MIPILYTPHEPQYHEPIITVFFHIHSVFISPSMQLFVSLYHTLFEASCYFGDSLIKLNISSIYPYRRSLFSYFRNFLYFRNHYFSVLWVMRTLPPASTGTCLRVAAVIIIRALLVPGGANFVYSSDIIKLCCGVIWLGSRCGQFSTNTTTETVEFLPFKLSDHRNVEKLKVAVKAQRTILGCQRDNCK